MTFKDGTRNAGSLLPSPHCPLLRKILSIHAHPEEAAHHVPCHLPPPSDAAAWARGGHLTQASQSEFLSQEFGNRSLWVSQLAPRRHAIRLRSIQSRSKHRTPVTVSKQIPEAGVKRAGVQGKRREHPAPGLAESPWATSRRGWTVSAGDLWFL